MKRPRLLFGNFGWHGGGMEPPEVPNEHESLTDRFRGLLGVIAIIAVYGIVVANGGLLHVIGEWWRPALFIGAFVGVGLALLYLVIRLMVTFPRAVLGVLSFFLALFFVVRFVKWAWM